MFFGTLTLYIILFLAVMGVLTNLFGVKFTYYGRVCDIALSGQEISADNVKIVNTEF